MNDRACLAVPPRCRDNAVVLVVLLLVAATKIWSIAAYHQPLLGEFWRMVIYADHMIGGTEWLRDAGVAREAIPPDLWKPVGYPLLMAAMKLVTGEHWTLTIFSLQAVASVAAGWLVFRLAAALGLPIPWAAAVFLLYEWSLPLSTDPLLMADSLVGSLGTVLLTLIAAQALRDKAPSLLQGLGWGAMVAVLFLLREIFEYMVAGYALAVLVLFWRAGQRARTALACVMVIIPVATTDFAVRSWNDYRSGAFIVTTGLQTAGLHTVMQVAIRSPELMAGDDAFDLLAREGLTNREYGDAQRLNQLAFDRFGLQAPEMAALTKRKMLQAMTSYPRAFMGFALDEIKLQQQASLLGGPLTRIDDLDWWHAMTKGPGAYDSGWRGPVRNFLRNFDLSVMTWDAWANLLPRIAGRVCGAVLFIVFALGTPYVWARQRAEPAWRILLAGWLLYWGLVALHLTVHLEMRYLSAVGAIPVLGSVYLLHYCLNRRHTRRGSV